MKVKIIQYNILNGFCGDNPPFIIDKKRMRAVCRLLNKEKPDILVLNESFFWPFALKQKAKDYNKFFSSLYSMPDLSDKLFRWAPSIVSRFPITFQDLSTDDFKFIKANIKIGKKKLVLHAYHPSHKTNEEQKEESIKKIFSYPLPDIIVGDFNSLSSEDKYDKNKLIRGFRTFMGKNGDAKVKDLLRAKMIKRILDAGFKDTLYSAGKSWDYTMPSDLRSKNKDSAIRMDFIFSKGFKVIDAGIIRNKLTDMASDHYPVYAVLEIK